MCTKERNQTYYFSMSIKSLNTYNRFASLYSNQELRPSVHFYLNWALWLSKTNKNVGFFHNKLVLNFWKIYLTIKTFYSELFTVSSFWMSVFVSQLRRRTITEANRKYTMNSCCDNWASNLSGWIDVQMCLEKDLTTLCCIYSLTINVYYQTPKYLSEFHSPFFPISPSILCTSPEREGEYISVFTDDNSEIYFLFLIFIPGHCPVN